MKLVYLIKIRMGYKIDLFLAWKIYGFQEVISTKHEQGDWLFAQKFPIELYGKPIGGIDNTRKRKQEHFVQQWFGILVAWQFHEPEQLRVRDERTISEDRAWFGSKKIRRSRIKTLVIFVHLTM